MIVAPVKVPLALLSLTLLENGLPAVSAVSRTTPLPLVEAVTVLPTTLLMAVISPSRIELCSVELLPATVEV